MVARVLSGPWLVNESICKKSSLGNIANLFLSEFKLVPRVNKKHLVSTLAWANVFPCYCSQSRGFWASRVAKPRATAFRSPLRMIVQPHWRTRRSWGRGWDRSAKFKFFCFIFRLLDAWLHGLMFGAKLHFLRGRISGLCLCSSEDLERLESNEGDLWSFFFGRVRKSTSRVFSCRPFSRRETRISKLA